MKQISDRVMPIVKRVNSCNKDIHCNQCEKVDECSKKSIRTTLCALVNFNNKTNDETKTT